MENIKLWFKDIKKECPRCKGELKVDCDCDNGWIMCKKCNGTGNITSSNYKTEKKEAGNCGTCVGKGKIHCPECHGEAYITNENGNEVKCLSCRGGVIKCKECNGTGKKYENIKVLDKTTTDCNCNGGKIECKKCDHNHEMVCPRCKGKGQVYKLEKVVIIAIAVFLALQFFDIFVNLALIMLALVVIYKLVKHFTSKSNNKA